MHNESYHAYPVAKTTTKNMFSLSLTLNSTKLKPGQSINITVNLYYNGKTPFYLNVSKNGINLPSPFPYGNTLLVGLEIFKGYYTTSNISNATPLSIYNNLVVSCICIIHPN
ncbi:hypothetical protein [Acidianus brierleyi]|uniref:hypothetical protein n=1 Tax=Acidianus brierleyi TaxID=41673 RepID=UPI001FE46458|nr:hypothetical protein [Acidianus brierleyi]